MPEGKQLECQFPACVAVGKTDLCVTAGPEEDDVQVFDESYLQHAKPLPLPVHQPPAGMGSFSLQHALLHWLHGTGIDLCPRMWNQSFFFFFLKKTSEHYCGLF